MPNETYMTVTKLGGIPSDEYSETQWGKLPVGEEIKVTWSRPRNLKFHRLFFAALYFLFEQQDMYSVLDDLRADIAIRLGHCEEGVYRGKKSMRPKSISFAKMDEEAFRQFFDGFVLLACESIAPYLELKDFDQFLEILDGDSGKIGKRIK